MRPNSPRDVISFCLLALACLCLLPGCGSEAPPAPNSGSATTATGVASPAGDASETGAAATASASPSSSAAPGEAATAPELSESVGLLVTVPELRLRIGQPGTHVLDARSAEDYEAGHIAGAVRVDVATWKNLAFEENGLKNSEAWGLEIGKLGVEQYDNIVVYADTPTDAARVWWTLRYLGLNHSGLLDGGWSAWVAAEGEVSTETPDVEPTFFEPDFQEHRLAQIDEVKAALGGSDLTIVDSRSPEEYTGAGEGKGRIPGAVLVEWKELLDDQGKFKSPPELKVLFENRGVTQDKAAVTYCQSGGRAAVDAFALELAGFGKVKNYYCSWSEWSKAADAPVEQGEKQE